ncbi:hypothetical protein [Apilactobacillus xinyiensis]|uniref:hypothetical protein n=1 Tax=Apilactobacillus xinyiensis TaxID=2841032 RepID=UPI001C7CB28B|nr:hypothetical protein [Apilactobacillus xinyiensis]
MSKQLIFSGIVLFLMLPSFFLTSKFQLNYSRQSKINSTLLNVRNIFLSLSILELTLKIYVEITVGVASIILLTVCSLIIDFYVVLKMQY